MFSWSAFLTYAFVTAITPGSNNIMSMTHATRRGFFRALPFNCGIFAGFLFLIGLCTCLSTLVATLIPKIEGIMLAIGATYILYLAWSTWKSGDSLNSNNKGDYTDANNPFFTGLWLQFINPKLYLYSIISMKAYIVPHYGAHAIALLGFVILLAFIGFFCTVLWSAFGAFLKVLFLNHAQRVNAVMALLLVYCAISLFF